MTLHVVARQSVQCLNEMIRLPNNYAQPFSGFITFYNAKKVTESLYNLGVRTSQ